jgi:hypothetical protein
MATESNEQTEKIEVDYEKIARDDGWCPKEEWRGDPNRWFDAKTFVERGATILPVVQAKYRKTLETVGELQKTVEELKEGNRLFNEFHEKTISKERKEREAAIAALEAERAKAITDGDGQTFTIKDRQIREMQQSPPKEDALPPATQAWLADNAWYQTDPVLKSMADGLADLVARENPGLKGRAFLDKLTERVQAEVPHKFKNARRDELVTEVHDAKKVPNSKAKTYENLPQESKAACDKFIRTIPGFTREKYLSQYDWSEQ